MNKKYITKDQAIAIFEESIKGSSIKNDKVGLRCAWLDFVDSLCKDGQITENKFNNWSNPYYKKEK